MIGNENARRYFEAVQGADGQAGELFGIRNLFRLQTDGTCLTRRILEVSALNLFISSAVSMFTCPFSHTGYFEMTRSGQSTRLNLWSNLEYLSLSHGCNCVFKSAWDKHDD